MPLAPEVRRALGYLETRVQGRRETCLKYEYLRNADRNALSMKADLWTRNNRR